MNLNLDTNAKMPLFKVIIKDGDQLTLRGKRDRYGNYLFINERKEYYMQFDPIKTVPNDTIRSMILICDSCKLPVRYSDGMVCKICN
jgi:hypothetical protein